MTIYARSHPTTPKPGAAGAPRGQFRLLYRSFLARVVDPELLTPGAQTQKVLVQFAAMLAAFNLIFAVTTVRRYTMSGIAHARLMTLAWQDQEFLISTTMAVAGMLSVLAWNTILPDRRDALVLGLLPLRTRTIALARAAAVGTMLGTSIFIVNLFSGMSYPFLVASGSGSLAGIARSLAAYWITMIAAGIFVCCALLALQGVAGQILSYRLFLRISSLLQLAAFLAVLGLYFFKPQLSTISGLTAPQNQRLISWLPSYWFLGLFQQLNGPMHPVFRGLALKALWAVFAAALLAIVTYALAYSRNTRRAIEQPEIAPADRSRHAARAVSWLAATFFQAPLDRAVFLFTARTIARSRQHRLLFAVYGGLGLAASLAFAGDLLHGKSSDIWRQPHASLLTAGLVLLFFVIVGTRAVFAFPITLPANWIFRITAMHSPSAYFNAVRRSLLSLTVTPVLMALAVLYFVLWPGRVALQHLAVLVIIASLLVESLMYRFRKIPFVCSYLPGKANLNVRLGIYALGFLFVADLGLIEFWAMQHTARFVVLLAVLIAIAIWARRRRIEFVSSAYNRIQFEDLPPEDLLSLDLRGEDAASTQDVYIDRTVPRPDRTLKARLKRTIIAALVILAAGSLYEKAGEWRDSRRFPQVGQSVNVGGRTLNISCLGAGSPTVILESNWGAPGYSWIPVQREIAKFTRACWYDRAGYGWSDPGPFPNHSDSIARDLHNLLNGAQVAPPYILVGHAMGAFHVRVFRGLYPDKVAGLVLVDPMNEDMTIHIHNHIEALRPTVLRIRWALCAIGFVRLMASDPGTPPDGFTPEEWATVATLRRQPKSLIADGKEPPLWISGKLARASGGFGSMPVTVLSAGIQDEEEDPKLDHDHEWKLKLHERLAELSTAGKHVIVNCGHNIPYEAPDEIVAAVREMVVESRQRMHSSS